MGLIEKPRCILHVGMPKTGTTSIQSTFAKQSKNLDFEYIVMGLGNNAYPICGAFAENPEYFYRGMCGELDIEAYQQKNLVLLTNLLRSNQAKIVIISSEDICNLTETGLQRLKEFLGEYCQSIQVVGYIRPIIDYMQSSLQQVIKCGITEFEYPCYRYKFEKFDNIFGREHVLLLKFDTSTLFNNDVVLDFCHHIGVSIDPSSIVRENQSLSLEAISLLYTYYKLSPEVNESTEATQQHYLFLQLFSNLGRQKLVFSMDLINTLLKNNSADIKWMEERLGRSLTEHLADTTNGISSLDDLLNLSAKFSSDLKLLLISKLLEQTATPQTISDWIRILHVYFSNQDNNTPPPVYSSAQIDQLKTHILQLRNLLKDTFLALNSNNIQNTIINLRSQITSILQAGIEESIDSKQTVSCSLDMYKDGYLLGWVFDKSAPSKKLMVELYSSQGFIGQGLADQFRQDLQGNISDDGCCAFGIKTSLEAPDFGPKIVLRVVNYNKFFYIKSDLVEGLN